MDKLFSYVAIPCDDFERAFDFYSKLVGNMIQRNPNVPFPMAYFVDENKNNVGHLFQLDGFKPSDDGTLVYLKLARDINETLARVVDAGGRVKMPKTLIAPGKGFWALFYDSEGNKLALHSSE